MKWDDSWLPSRHTRYVVVIGDKKGRFFPTEQAARKYAAQTCGQMEMVAILKYETSLTPLKEVPE